jgi:hypothetical protein
LTERDGFHVNVTGGWFSAVAGLVLWRRTPGVAAGVLLTEAGNVVMHAGMAVRERRYTPGVVPATAMMGPHAGAGVRWLARSGRVSRRQGLLRAPSEAPLCGAHAARSVATALQRGLDGAAEGVHAERFLTRTGASFAARSARSRR